MRQHIVYLLVLVTASSFLAAVGDAQEAAPANQRAIESLTLCWKRMAAFVETQETYRLEVLQQWNTDGEQPFKGSNRAVLVVKGDQFRLDVIGSSDDNATLTCVGDQAGTVRRYCVRRRCVYSKTPGGLSQLLDDSMTEESLRAMGFDLVCRPDLPTHAMAMLSDVERLPDSKVEGRALQHFRGRWNGQSVIEFWFADGQQPLLQKLEHHLPMVGSNGKQQLTVTTRLSWDFEPDVEGVEFQLDLPDHAEQVLDLKSYLLEGGTWEFINRKVPQLELITIDGKNWQHEPAGHLHVFCVWSPRIETSVETLTKLNELTQRHKDLHAIAVGVGQGDSVRDHLAELTLHQKVWTHLLDSSQQAMDALKISALPTLIIVDHQGIVRGVHHQLDELFKQQLQAAKPDR